MCGAFPKHPLRNSIRCSSLVVFSLTKLSQMQEEHDMFRTEPTIGSVCGGIYDNFSLRNAMSRRTACGAVIAKIMQTPEKRRIFRNKPNHCISLWRNVRRFSLCPTATGQNSNTRDDLTRQVPQMLQQYFHSNDDQDNTTRHFRSFTEGFHHVIPTEYSHQAQQEGNHPNG